MGDILVKEWESISYLIYCDSIFFAEIYEEVLLYTFYRAFLTVYIILMLNIHDCAYGSSLWNSV